MVKNKNVKPVVYILFSLAVLVLVLVFFTQFVKLDDPNSLLKALTSQMYTTTQTKTPKPGICGEANTTYLFASTTYDKPFCKYGAAKIETGSFSYLPKIKEKTIWRCEGTDGTPEEVNRSCFASRSDIRFSASGWSITHFGGPNDPYTAGQTGAVTLESLDDINVNSLYAAYPMDYNLTDPASMIGDRPASELRGYSLKITYGGKSVTAPLIDHGPGREKPKTIDVSLGVQKALGIRNETGVKVSVTLISPVK